VAFNISASDIPTNLSAILSVNLAGYSGGESDVLVNGNLIGRLGGSKIPADPSLYGSATTAG
jgi:rhamnogalacturonan endolyase